MDPCEELRVDLDIALEIRSDARSDAVIRFFLRLIGFEWVYDLIKGKGVDFTILLDLLTALDLAGAIRWLIQVLREEKLDSVAKRLLARIGPFTVLILAAILVTEIVTLTTRLLEIGDQFERSVRELYRSTDCTERDQIFREKGVAIPG